VKELRSGGVKELRIKEFGIKECVD